MHAWAVVARRERMGRMDEPGSQGRLPWNRSDIPELALRNLLVLAPQNQATALLRLSSTGGAL